ncbi:DUF3348 domain-containing protein [Pusillimonas sp. ANT_WB101]|uniref:DUF3348 domain-containing protein n=1 Tax=Pusillimonas sp. ANT_WB101 TaxID=2597356 RepID=UPI00351A541E
MADRLRRENAHHRVNSQVFDPHGMVQEPPRRTGFSGPPLVRLLARLTDTTFYEPRQDVPNRLSQWLGWADAIALSSALKGNSSSVPSGLQPPAEAGKIEYDRVRAALELAITGNERPATAQQEARLRAAARRGPTASTAVVDYASYRRRYVLLQQSMESSIATLRGRLRTLLASISPQAARLAVVDAAMEQALSEREFVLFADIPKSLEAHFERLRNGAEQTIPATGGPSSPSVGPTEWLTVFKQDMQRVLFAELDTRLQPVEALLAALHEGKT